MPDLQAVQRHSPAFFEAYRHSEHHSALNGHCPADLHPVLVHCPLPSEIHSADRLPLTAGKVHFIRRVDQDKKVMILNINWEVPAAKPDQGVWAILRFTLNEASLRIYDQAPDAKSRSCLAEHVFLLKEEVVPLSPEFDRSPQAARPSFFRAAVNLAIDRFFGLVSSMF